MKALKITFILTTLMLFAACTTEKVQDSPEIQELEESFQDTQELILKEESGSETLDASEEKIEDDEVGQLEQEDAPAENILDEAVDNEAELEVVTRSGQLFILAASADSSNTNTLKMNGETVDVKEDVWYLIDLVERDDFVMNVSGYTELRINDDSICSFQGGEQKCLGSKLLSFGSNKKVTGFFEGSILVVQNMAE